MSVQYYASISVRETDYARPEVRTLFGGEFSEEEPNVEDGIVTLEDYRSDYGHFPELELSLERLGVAFDRRTVPYEEFPETIAQNRPGNGLKAYPMLDGECAIPISCVRAMKEKMTAEEFYAWAGSLSEPSPL